jgi:hypothetical protein
MIQKVNFAHSHFQKIRLKGQTSGAASLRVQFKRPNGSVVFKQATISALLATAAQEPAGCFLTNHISRKTTCKQIVFILPFGARIKRNLILRPGFINCKRNNCSYVNYLC